MFMRLSLMAARFTILAFMLHVFISANTAFAAEWKASSGARSEWQALRRAYPYHVQLVAASAPREDGSRLLVIAEPPATVTLRRLQNMMPEGAGPIRVFRHKIGYDGWVKDAVVALPPLKDEAFKDVVARLHEGLFGSSYRADAVRLPVSGSKIYRGDSLDLSVSAAELHKWLVVDDMPLHSFLGDIRWSQAHADGQGAPSAGRLPTGVYFSEKPGLVVWSFPRNVDLTTVRTDARKFFADSDLILGAVASDRLVWIVGRERVEPYSRLPPLRTDVAIMLAGVRSKQLSQSYERVRIFAGKLHNGWDWAPIYLSKRLINTEYGSLLNITDQMLKSWSLDGAVKYIDFPYPKPNQWLEFPKPLLELIKKHGSVLFNWNTYGAGYRVAMDDGVEVIDGNRSGALPVIYRAGPDEKVPVREHEEKAYKYFAELGNADLARVVQYNTLYQIFRGLKVRASIGPVRHSQTRATTVLKRNARKLLDRIDNFSRNDLKPILAVLERETREKWDRVSPEVRQEIFAFFSPNLVKFKFLSPSDAAYFANKLQRNDLGSARARKILQTFQRYIFMNEALGTVNSVKALRIKLQEFETKFGRDALDIAGDVIADPRAVKLSYREVANAARARIRNQPLTAAQENVLIKVMALRIAKDLRRGYARRLVGSLVDAEGVKQQYTIASQRGGRWLKTPSIGLSKATGAAKAIVGGHNLDSSITEFRASTLVKPGDIRIVTRNGKKTLLYNPADAKSVGELSRSAALGKSDPNLAVKLSKTLRESNRSIRVPEKALALDARATRSARGLVPERYQLARQEAGWREAVDPLSPAEAAANRSAASTYVPSYIIEPWEGGFRIRNAANGVSREAATPSSAIETLSEVMEAEAAAGREVQVIAHGVSPRQMRVMLESANLQGARGQAKAHAFLRSGKRPFNQSMDLLTRRYDWGKATVRRGNPPARLVTSGAWKGKYEHTFMVHVPPVKAGASTLMMRVLLYAKSLLPEAAALKLERAIQTALLKSQSGVAASGRATKTSTGGRLDVRETILNIREELKAIDPTLEKEIRFDGEAGDSILADYLREGGRAGRVATG